MLSARPFVPPSVRHPSIRPYPPFILTILVSKLFPTITKAMRVAGDVERLQKVLTSYRIMARHNVARQNEKVYLKVYEGLFESLRKSI